MNIEVKVDGVERLMRLLRKRLVKVRTAKPTLDVGYTAPYAIYVHEDLTANHPNGGQAKYLEQPAREMANELGGLIRARVKTGVPMEEALYEAGEKLLDRSKELVPIDTGYLRDSGYVRLINGSKGGGK